MVETSGVDLPQVSTIGRFCASRKPPSLFV
jgi:hypothetical protein